MRADKPILSYGALSNLNIVRQRMYQMNLELISYPVDLPSYKLARRVKRPTGVGPL